MLGEYSVHQFGVFTIDISLLLFFLVLGRVVGWFNCFIWDPCLSKFVSTDFRSMPNPSTASIYYALFYYLDQCATNWRHLGKHLCCYIYIFFFKYSGGKSGLGIPIVDVIVWLTRWNMKPKLRTLLRRTQAPIWTPSLKRLNAKSANFVGCDWP